MRVVHRSRLLDCIKSCRLDYQPLLGKMSPHSSPGEDQRPDPGDGGNRAYKSCCYIERYSPLDLFEPAERG